MSAIPTTTSALAQPTRSGVPELQNGDRLTRSEFERRYRAMPEATKAELIEGIVFMSSPVRLRRHGKPHMWLSAWLVRYATHTPGLTDYGDNVTARLDQDNEPQPDLSLLLPKRVGGLAEVGDDDYINGAPAWVAEIAASSVSIDLHSKLNAYRRNGVREYVVWRTEEVGLDWLVLREGQYVQLPVDAAGVVRSEQFPGLWLDVPALLRGDFAAVERVLDAGLASPEHAAFMAKLKG